MSKRDGLVRKPTVDKNGKATTVLVNPTTVSGGTSRLSASSPKPSVLDDAHSLDEVRESEFGGTPAWEKLHEEDGDDNAFIRWMRKNGQDDVPIVIAATRYNLIVEAEAFGQEWVSKKLARAGVRTWDELAADGAAPADEMEKDILGQFFAGYARDYVNDRQAESYAKLRELGY
jgi:hypothetical protein